MLLQKNRTGHPVKYVRSRSGSMLLLVLVIMAVAIILITSALTITVKARQRYYMNSTTSQARLTATSTAMTIAEAIISADFKSSDLEALAAANGGTGTTVIVNSATGPASTDLSADNSSADAVAPGLYNNGSFSYTNAVVSYYPSFADQQYLTVTVNTGLDVYGNASSNTQSVTLYLEEIPVSPISDAFASMVSLGGESTLNSLPQIRLGYDLNIFRTTGEYVRATGVESNYAVIHGNVLIAPSGTQQLFSDMIYTGNVALGAGTTFFGNQIFSGDDASINVASGGNGMLADGGHILFLGETPYGASVFSDAAGNPTTVYGGLGAGVNAQVSGTEGGGIYLMNTVFSSGMNWNVVKAGKGFVVADSARLNYLANGYNPIPGSAPAAYLASGSASGFWTPGGTFTAYSPATDTQPIVIALRALAAKYTSPTIVSQINRTIRTYAEALAENLTPYGTAAEVNAGVAGGDVTMLTSTDLTSVGTRTYTDSAYCINAAATNLVGKTSWSAQTKLVFDLATNDITIYIIGNGNTLTFASGVIQFINGGTHVGRICLVDGVKISMNQNNYSYDVGIIGSNHEAASGSKTRVVNKSPVFLYIYGMNSNSIYVTQNDTLEGYIGLYGANGTLTMDNGPLFYGRIESTVLKYTSGDPMTFPYCPSPKESLSNPGGMVRVESSYRVAGYQYS